MRLDDLLKPVSPDEPCGPDLMLEDDPDFGDYYFEAEGRLPSDYFDLRSNTLFDPRSIDAKAETTAIDALLKRSRDIRLLVLEAKFQILAGRFKGFADAVMAIAALLEAFPDDLNPRCVEDEIDRQNALEELDTNATIVAPLEYAVLLTDRRAGDVMFRAYATGRGIRPPRAEEEVGDASGILTALGSSENAKAVDTLHGQLAGLLEALAKIRTLCRGAASHSFSPRFDKLETRLAEMLDMVRVARTDLDPNQTTAAPTADATTDSAASQALPYAPGQPAPPPPGAVTGHAHARRLLTAAESYFARNEPSALALILVTQSRLLIGRPLVEALDVLLEQHADDAKIDFGSQTGFRIPMARMRSLSEEMGLAAPGEEEDGQDAPDVAPILSRDQAAGVLKTVEDFYRQREPASPIPILLFKARNMINKDFHAIVRELLPPDPDD